MKKLIAMLMFSSISMTGCVDDKYICAVEDPKHPGQFIEIDCPPGFVPPAQASDESSTGK